MSGVTQVDVIQKGNQIVVENDYIMVNNYDCDLSSLATLQLIVRLTQEETMDSKIQIWINDF